LKSGVDSLSFISSGGHLTPVNPLEAISHFKTPFYISTYKCTDSYVDFFSRIHSATPVQKNISIDAVELPELLMMIEEKKVTGFMESWRGDRKKRYVYFYNGKILGYVNIKQQDVFFEKSLDRATVQSVLSNSTANIYQFTNLSGAGEDSRSPSTASRHKQPASPSSPPPLIDNDRLQMIMCYEEIFQLIEQEITHDKFDSTWRTCAMELSEKYAFLNPFAGEFNYVDGRMDLWEKVEAEEAANAFEALSNLISKRTNLPKDGIRAVKNNYIDILVAYEIRN